FTSPGELTQPALVGDVGAQLLFRLSDAASYPVLGRLLASTQRHSEALAGITLDDLLNAPLRPETLSTTAIELHPGRPELTTDYSYISQGSEDWVALEMDDAVVAHACEGHDVEYAFVRNISDPLVPAATQDGTPISSSARQAWSGA